MWKGQQGRKKGRKEGRNQGSEGSGRARLFGLVAQLKRGDDD